MRLDKLLGSAILAALMSLCSACESEMPAVPPGQPDSGVETDGGDGDAGACAFSGPCDPGGGDPCKVGELGCDANGAQLCTATNAPNGKSCGAGLVCLEGVCQACEAGASCADPSNPCSIGALSCESGTPVCSNLTNAPDGTNCGTGMVCSAGQCLSCVQDAKCSDAINPCLEGKLDCSAGVACVDLANAPDGTTCGQNFACLGGACVCEPGGVCHSDNPCQAGTAACVNDQPVCENIADLPDGTSCGQNMACVDGACACQPGTSCTLEGEPCKLGSISCDSGSPVCAASGNVPNGTTCGTDQVCLDGACVACAAGGACLFGVCKLGTYSCDTGTRTCEHPTDAQDGTVCDTNGTADDEVCNNGSCVPCVSGDSCSPDVCLVGVTDCSSGHQQCINVQDAPEGTDCGANQFCLSGQCTTCNTGDACHPSGDPCKLGTLSCDTGLPVCTFTENEQDDTTCGPSKVCQSGSCVCDDECATAGESVCNTANDGFETCTRDATTGCLSLVATDCSANQTCSGGACVCNDTCPAAGDTQCAGGNAIQSCSADADGCLSWSPSPAALCPGGVACAAGQCSCPAPGANDLYVNNLTGSDLFGNGSETCPFSTISKGLAEASGRTGDQLVHVAVSFTDYGPGETFPLVVPPNTTLIGDSLMVLTPTVRGDGPAFDGMRATILANGGAVESLTLQPATTDQADTVGVACNAGSPHLTGLTLQNYAEGMLFAGGCTSVVATCDVRNSSAGGGRAAIVVTGSASAEVSGTNVVNNEADGVFVDSSSATPTTLLNNGNLNSTWGANGLSRNAGHGVRCAGSASIRLQANKVWSNGLAGVLAEGACHANLSGTGGADACDLANDIGCNHRDDSAWANLHSTSSAATAADHNVWRNDPPREGAGQDYLAAGTGAVDVSNTCGTSNCR